MSNQALPWPMLPATPSLPDRFADTESHHEHVPVVFLSVSLLCSMTIAVGTLQAVRLHLLG